MSRKFRVLGIDPGLLNSGWGVIDVEGTKLLHVAHGVIKVQAKQDMDIRLNKLFLGVQAIVKQYQPDEAAIEETFLNKNPATTLRLGLARGVVMVAPTTLDIRVSEYSANHVKKMVVGAGHADKEQVKTMIQYLLPQCNDEISFDASDALAIAICHAHTMQTKQTWNIK